MNTVSTKIVWQLTLAKLKRWVMYAKRPSELDILNCLRKNKFLNKKLADQEIYDTLKFRTTELKSYQCPVCEFWHLTSGDNNGSN